MYNNRYIPFDATVIYANEHGSPSCNSCDLYSDVTGSNLDPDTDYPEGFVIFPSSSKGMPM
jgi:hypothetical protein